MSDETKVSVGEFEVEIYDEIENSLEDIISVVQGRISLKKLKKISTIPTPFLILFASLSVSL